ncbi:hypothetical protein BS47DRAFT_1326481 [Hydnum rufescens UP504]|uniref:Protein kinase domain-containing protein n=1 Tax=Hydnum rufescens UP504 TaxID=1448309 RepID=A0A9P6B471_9AGAM|nr:hypothetical protein BS47DRAFT_1326481 [Hydnum rufescens UP504]
MAPELLDLEIPRGDLTPYTEATDIYSFAMTTIEVYTGLMPFPHLRHNVGAALLAQARPSRPVRTVLRTLSETTCGILFQKCWLEEPAHRLSAGDARQRLEIHRKGRLPIAM